MQITLQHNFACSGLNQILQIGAQVINAMMCIMDALDAFDRLRFGCCDDHVQIMGKSLCCTVGRHVVVLQRSEACQSCEFSEFFLFSFFFIIFLKHICIKLTFFTSIYNMQ